MTFLSAIDLNPYRRKTALFASNPRTLHAAVMNCFSPDLHAKEKRILWRLDQSTDRISLLVLSENRPCFEHIQEQAGWSNQPSSKIRDYNPLLEGLQPGQQYRFRLAANPTRIVTQSDGKKIRAAHVTVKHQKQWLRDKITAHGFSIYNGNTTDDETEMLLVTRRDRLRFNREKARVTLNRVQFDGVLTVESPELLRNAMLNGIGRGKGYGMGLLTLSAS
ncbi:type I-E CRISPR-associated protein Cas6/Cse3/CasE [Corynebacterium kutscheri]|uniref:type I-E CRISPR-associated protein Cas6/Cse3/CasE n=1 Tax=Corynebacterium kutscheri TaxID=35755 RepID=UPI0006235E82|nr:type I-E CRISPR-associated protein Cas6/Cse3/CasE [Corynebacterium kutscheri]VEH09358.1 Cse3 family CRISPR-associated protein [Corynebacterium kutscheri]